MRGVAASLDVSFSNVQYTVKQMPGLTVEVEGWFNMDRPELSIVTHFGALFNVFHFRTECCVQCLLLSGMVCLSRYPIMKQVPYFDRILLP